MNDNFARSSYNSRSRDSTPAGQRQNVLGVYASAMEPNSINSNPHSSLYTRTKAGDVTSRYRTSQSKSNIYRIQTTNTPIRTTLGGPPPLLPVVPIPLPPLSPTIPVQTHPLITYRLHHAKVNSPILWNISLPPSTARLAAALNSAPSWPWWRKVAVRPNGLPSMTIRVQGVQRPIVVFPSGIGHPISISDIMNATYNAVRTSAVVASNADESNTMHLIFGPGPDDGNQEVGSINAVPSDAIHRHFRGQVWWAGLRASTDEVDVWILQLQGRRRGGRH